MSGERPQVQEQQKPEVTPDEEQPTPGDIAYANGRAGQARECADVLRSLMIAAYTKQNDESANALREAMEDFIGQAGYWADKAIPF